MRQQLKIQRGILKVSCRKYLFLVGRNFLAGEKPSQQQTAQLPQPRCVLLLAGRVIHLPFMVTEHNKVLSAKQR